MKKFYLPLLILLFSVHVHANTIRLQQEENRVTLLENRQDHVILEYTISQFETTTLFIDGKEYQQLQLEKNSNLFIKGDPALPYISRSIIIPDNKGVSIAIVEQQFEDLQMAVAPSKGIIYRDQDPASVPCEFSPVYQTNELYPSAQTELGDPYILRDFRGVNIKVFPFRYNPVKEQLRVCTRMVIRIDFEGKAGKNVKVRKDDKINIHFKPIYRNHFANFDETRYPTVGESGRMLVICHPGFMTDIAPYIQWKLEKGIQTDLVDVSAIGTTTTAILNFIQGEYNLGNGLTFVQFVGDDAQIPTFTYSGGGSDPTYSLLDGSDDYPDIIVGRFSAETSAEVQTQVERTVHYERDLSWGSWLHEGTGIASEQGAGVGWNGLADWEHMDVLRTRLLNFNYTLIDQFYGNNGATATDVTNALNTGRGILNYCGHGGTGGWATTGFNSTHVNNLTNDYMLPFIHSVACVNGNFTGTTCFAEDWLRATNGGDPTGGVAMYASSINQSWVPPMVAQDYSIQHLVDEDYYSLGALWYNGSCAMIDIKGQAGVDMFMTWHIFGDGSLSYRTDTPGYMSVTHDPGISSGQTTFFVNTGVVGALVSLSCPGEIVASGVTNINGQVYLSLPSTINCPLMTLTVTAYNKITYQGEVIANGDGVWSGTASTDWHNANNWLDSQVPDASQNVTIISGRPNYPVVTGTAECASLMIESGASLDVTGYKLTINGHLDVFGELGITGSTSQLVVTADVNWESGSTENITGTSSIFEVRGHWNVYDGSTVGIDYGFVKFTGAFSSTVKIYDPDFHFRHLIVNKDPGKYLLYSNSSTQNLHVIGNMFVYTDAQYRQYSVRNLIVDGLFDTDGEYRFYGGTFQYSGPGIIHNPVPGSYFNNLILNSGGTFDVMIDTEVRGDLTINGGALDLNGNTLTIDGDWSNNVGTAGFTETGSRVIFNGASDQTIGNHEDFGALELDNGGYLLNMGGKDITCDVYDWTSGGLNVANGTFTAADLADSGIFGSYLLDVGGTIDLTNADGWVDMNADIYMDGGFFYVRGGNGSSWWSYGADASLHMSGGILDFTDQSIYLYDSPSYTFFDNITGGTIRTVGSFTGDNPNFNPAGGDIELYGTSDCDLAHAPGSSFYAVTINKSAEEGSGKIKQTRLHPGEKPLMEKEGGKANQVAVQSTLDIDTDLRIEAGTFDVNGFTVDVADDLYIAGHLIMDDAADVIYAGDQVDWAAGSTATCTAGKIYFGGMWSFLDGSEALISPGHLSIANGSANQSLKNRDDNSCFGDLDINHPGFTTNIDIQTNHPVLISGDLILYNNSELLIDHSQVIPDGLFYIDDLATLTVTAGGGSIVNGDLTCNGTIYMNGGSLFTSAGFLMTTTGSLIIDDGQFILHAPYTGTYESIGGYVELNGGVFQVTYNGIQFGSASQFIFNGGDMRIGWSFRAVHPGTIQPGSGAVEFFGTGSPSIDMESSNYFHDLIINKEGTGTVYLAQPLTINNDLTIQDGTFNTFGHDLTVMGSITIETAGKLNPYQGNIYVKGDWTNNNGPNGFVELNSLVSFIDFNSCFIRTDETFHNLEVNKDNPSYNILYLDSAIMVTVEENFSVMDGRMSMRDNATVHVMNDMYVNSDSEVLFLESYTNRKIIVDGVMEIANTGSVTLTGGDTVTCNSDLLLLGTLNITNSSVKVHGYFSSGQYSSFVMNSGEFIYDETGTTYSYLRGTFEMNDGLFEFTHKGLGTSSLLTSSIITGGLVKVGGHFKAIDLNTWMQTGGKLLITGGADVSIECSAGNHFHDVEVDKSAGTATLASDIHIRNDFLMSAGSLNTDVYDMYVGGDWTNTAGPAAIDKGTNKVVFCYDQSSTLLADETFYDLHIDKPATSANYLLLDNSRTVDVLNNMDVLDGRFRMKSNTNLNVSNDMTLWAGTETQLHSAYTNSILEVGGKLDIKSGSTMELHTGDTATVNGTLVVAGELSITDASVYAHGFFSSATNSSFTLTSGQFINDEPGVSWVYLRGSFKMLDGLFEITTKGLQTTSMMSSSTVDGGIVRVGGNFSAAVADTWKQSGGKTLVFGDANVNIDCSAGNYFHDLEINKSTGIATLQNNVMVKRDFDMEAGTLETNGFDMDIGRNWTNNAGAGSINMGTNTVTFFSDQPGTVFTDEQFNIMLVNKPGITGPALTVADGLTIDMAGKFEIVNGSVLLSKYNTIDIAGDLVINQGAGLNANPSVTNVEIYCNGHWTDKNTSYNDVVGFNPGLSGVFLTGTIDQNIYQDDNLASFYNLTVDKSSGQANPEVNIAVLNDFKLLNGKWGSVTAALTFGFFGNITIGSGGMWSDDVATVEILGDAVRYYENLGSGNTYFNTIVLDMLSDGVEASAMLILNSDLEADNLEISNGTLTLNDFTLDCINNLFVYQDGFLMAQDNSEIRMGSGANLHILGGALDVTGNTTNRPRITHISGYYNFSVDAGGIIAAAFADFQFMDQGGVHIFPNGNVHNSGMFENCSFSKGEDSGVLLTIENNQNMDIYNAHFPDNIWNGKFNVSKDNNTGGINFYDATGGYAGEAYENDPYNLVNWEATGYKLALKAMLEGPYTSSAMSSWLTSFIPLDQPYNVDPWFYNGTENVAAPAADYVDWILVELRDATSAAQATSATMVARQAGFIRTDGAVLNTDGGEELLFAEPISNGLYVVIWHRNHLGIMSANEVVISGRMGQYDFTTGENQVYGGANGHQELDPGVWGMAGGDGNADGQVNNGDKIDVWSVEAGTGGYLNGDFNMDSQVNNGDKNDVWIPNTGLGGQVPDVAKSCQVPE